LNDWTIIVECDLFFYQVHSKLLLRNNCLNSIAPLFSAAIGAAVAALGWPIAHWLASKREVLAEKRKLRVTYILEAYRRLENAGNRPIGPESDEGRDIESALADIQLLGTPKQIELAVKFSDEFAAKGAASFDPILYDLRNSLRQELELEPTSAPLKFLRIA
jgi:hypothetical protein